MGHPMENTPLTFDGAQARKDFPVLTANPDVTFLDTAASAQKPQAVIDAVSDCYSRYYANIHRGVYKFSQQTTKAYEDARKTVASFINAESEKSIVFTRGATESINLVAQTWGRANLKRGDKILITEMEHHANIVPWQMLREQLGIELAVCPITDSGTVDMAEFEKRLEGVKLVAITQMSNAIGTRPPLEQMLAKAHEKGITTLVDGCQGVVHTPVDVQKLNCDFYVFSGHKLYGPSGIGVLYGKKELLDAMPPYQGGGEMISSVTFEKTTYAPAPGKFEAGTPHIAGAIGLAAAIDYINGWGQENIFAYENALNAKATEALKAIPGLTLYGTAPNREAILSFTVEGIHPHDMGTILDDSGVAVRAGHHCAQPLMKRFGLPATTRASIGLYNTEQDVDNLVKAIKKAQELFRG